MEWNEVAKENDARRQEMVNKLLKKPHPPNSYNWHRIVALTGNDGDYTPADEGMHRSDLEK